MKRSDLNLELTWDFSTESYDARDIMLAIAIPSKNPSDFKLKSNYLARDKFDK